MPHLPKLSPPPPRRPVTGLDPAKAKAELARRGLLAFTKYTKEDYVENWHHREYAAVLDRFARGECKRLMVFMPPQHGKSELCSRRLPAKLLGDHPDLRVAVVAYNHTFAAKFNRDIQRIITSPEYAALYPETKLGGVGTGYARTSDEFEVAGHRGSLISVGTGGGLTGNKVDVAIIDDPYKDAQQANSAAYRAMLEEWWDKVLMTRLHNDSRICLTFTRWRHDDIAGKLLALQAEGLLHDEWEVVRYQALKTEADHTPGDPRQPGEALWPKQLTTERLLNMQALGPQGFEALYQQNPTQRGGNVIRDTHFFRYSPGELPAGVTHCYIDTATSEKELQGNDPTGILFYRVAGAKLYLEAFYKGKWAMPELIATIKTLAGRHLQGRASKVYIENKSNGRSTKQMLAGSGLNVILENHKGGKMERVENELASLEAKRVGLPLGDVWVEGFLEQCMGFPLMAHDEEVDCLTGAMRMGLGVSKVRFA
jgi:predicted phage terminase large subunit-like protein